MSKRRENPRQRPEGSEQLIQWQETSSARHLRAAAIKSLEYSRWVPLGTVEEAAVAVDYLKAQVTDETTSKRDMGRKHNTKEFLAGYRRKTISSHPPLPLCVSLCFCFPLPSCMSFCLCFCLSPLSPCLCLSFSFCLIVSVSPCLCVCVCVGLCTHVTACIWRSDDTCHRDSESLQRLSISASLLSQQHCDHSSTG